MNLTRSIAVLAALGVGVMLFIGSAFGHRGEPLHAAATVADIAFHVKPIDYVMPAVEPPVCNPRPVAETPTNPIVTVADRLPCQRDFLARSNPV